MQLRQWLNPDTTEDEKTDLQRRLPVDNEIFQGFTSNANADTTDFFAADLDFDFTRMIDEDTIVAVGDVERDTFVGLIAGGATVLVPQTDGLS